MRQQWHGTTPGDERVVDTLVALSGLSKSAVKRAMTAGAVWTEEKGRRVRLRRAGKVLPAGVPLWLYYDRDILARTAPQAHCLHQEKGFSVWFKPAGLLTQGNQWGDHLSLMRQVEKAVGRPVWLVHRLDRETAGVVVLAHHRQAAAWLSVQFQQRRVEKGYFAWVRGQMTGSGVIDTPLDGKPARTHWRAVAVEEDVTGLSIRLESGRLHQIRRHLAAIGHPVMGDPRYGENNKGVPLQLLAQRLSFVPPGARDRCCFELSAILWRESGVRFIAEETVS